MTAVISRPPLPPFTLPSDGNSGDKQNKKGEEDGSRS